MELFVNVGYAKCGSISLLEALREVSLILDPGSGRISQQAENLLRPLIKITHKYTRASFHIDRIRDPRPRFGYWQIPKVLKTR